MHLAMASNLSREKSQHANCLWSHWSTISFYSCDTCGRPSMEVSKRQVLSLPVLLCVHKDSAGHTLTAAREPEAEAGAGTTETFHERPIPSRRFK